MENDLQSGKNTFTRISLHLGLDWMFLEVVCCDLVNGLRFRFSLWSCLRILQALLPLFFRRHLLIFFYPIKILFCLLRFLTAQPEPPTLGLFLSQSRCLYSHGLSAIVALRSCKPKSPPLSEREPRAQSASESLRLPPQVGASVSLRFPRERPLTPACVRGVGAFPRGQRYNINNINDKKYDNRTDI